MDSAEIIKHIDGYIKEEKEVPERGYDYLPGLIVAVVEFLRIYTGEKSQFFGAAKRLAVQAESSYMQASGSTIRVRLRSILQQYRSHVEAGLHEGVSPERQARMDVVSDFLGQADKLLSAPKMHPACAVMLAGASLEAFLREWAEAEDIRPSKSGLDGYAESLCKAEKINKQDKKDITSWAGLRNDAAHGDWEKVANKEQARIMLMGINLFMRKYGAKPRD